MQLFRISKVPHHRDLSGTGAKMFGGRWNSEGVPVLYTAENRSLAALETMVHTPMKLLHSLPFRLITVYIPDSFKIDSVSTVQLPEKWFEYPAPPQLAAIGDAWQRSLRTEVLRVPSVIMPGEFNYLINPEHPRAKEAFVTTVDPWLPDERFR